MTEIKIPKIEEFPQDGQYWRMDWIGAFVPNANITTEPFVQIYLSPLAISPMASPKDLASVNAVNWSGQKIIDIGVGQLPFIEKGSVWKNGLRQKALAGTSRVFSDLEISKDSIKLIRASHQVNNEFLIPQSQYRLGTGLNSWLVAVEYQGNPYGILIPAIELIRFYYAISTNLAQAVFSGVFRYGLDSIVHTDRTGYVEAEDRYLLGLRQQITDEEGWVIARILHSNIANQACLKIYDHFLEQAANEERFVNVKANFPFEGKTTLQARVKPMPFKQSDGTTKWHNLVLVMESCSAPMPYSELTVIRDNDGRQGEPETDIPKKDKKPYQRGGVTNNGIEGKHIQNKKDTNASLSSVSLTVASGRFTALTGRKPDKPTKEQTEYRSMGKPIAGLEVKALGTGLGGYGADEREVQRVNIVAERTRRQAAPPSFELFEEAIEYLNQQEGISASIRQGNELLEYMPFTKPSGKWQWAYLDSASRQRRRVIIADIMIGERYFNLIEFEQRLNESCTVCLLFSEGVKVSDYTLHDVLHQCSAQKGIWRNILSGFDIVALKHTWTGALSLANTLTQRVECASMVITESRSR